MVDANDAHILRRAAAGDDAATGQFIRTYVRRATLFARQLVGVEGDADDAEDIVAEVFVIALDRAATFREGESVGPWLYGIVRRVAAKYRRRAARRRGLLRGWRHLASAPPDPAQQAASRDAIDHVAAIVRSLPEMQRQCFDLVVHSELDISEVAVMFNIAPSTVRQHIHRAREAIRARFHA